MKGNLAATCAFVAITACLVTACQSVPAQDGSMPSTQGTDASAASETEYRTFEITTEQLQEATLEGKSMVVFYGQEDCGSCIGYWPVVEEAAQALGLSVGILDYDSVTDSSFLDEHDIFFTPTLIILHQGEVTRYEGYADLEATKLMMCGGLETEKDRLGEITPLSYDAFLEKMSQPTDFLLYVGKADCKDCQEFYPILEEYVDTHDGTGVYSIEVNELRAAREDAYEQLKESLDLQWLPTLYRIVNGHVASSCQYLSADYYAITDAEEAAAEKELAVEACCDWLWTQSK